MTGEYTLLEYMFVSHKSTHPKIVRKVTAQAGVAIQATLFLHL